MTSAQYHRTLTILHSAFIFGQLAFAGIAILLRSGGQMTFDAGELNTVLPPVAAGLAAAGAAGGGALFRKRRDDVRRQQGALSGKLAAYRGAHIIRWAMLEGPALFSIITFLLTGVYWVLGVVVLLVALFISYRPSPKQTVQDLQPSYEEEARILDPEAVVE